MRRWVGICWVIAAIAGCRGGADGETPPPLRDGEKKAPPVTEAEVKVVPPDTTTADPCGAPALGLGTAKALEPWTPPEGCAARGTGTELVRDDAGLAERLQCPSAPAESDFSRAALLSVAYTLSPAGAGVIAYDDGKTVTVVTRQRNPCADAPMPMPMSVTAWFVVPGGERSIATATCTLPPSCP